MNSLLKSRFFIFLYWSWVTQTVKSAIFSPLPRFQPATSILNDQIYFFGGTPVLNVLEKSFAFSLNLSIPFNITSPSWTKLAIESPIVEGALITSDIDNTDDPTIYAFVNINKPNSTVLVYKFDENAMLLKRVEAGGKSPLSRYEVSIVSDKAGKFYMFGGSLPLTSPNIRSNELNIYDLSTNIWDINVVPLIGSNPTISILSYSATFLDGLILYIGGRSGVFMNPGNSIDEYSFSTIHIYDTRSGSWYNEPAINGNKVIARLGHSAVLTPDRRIIIYGGSTWDNRTVKPDLAVLYVNSSNYEWFIPDEKDEDFSPPSLVGHSATLYKNYMILTFGVVPPRMIAPTSNLYLLDIQDYKWLTNFDPNGPSGHNDTKISFSTSSPGSKVKPIVIAFAIILPLCIILGGIILYFVYKKYKSKKKITMLIPPDCKEEI